MEKRCWDDALIIMVIIFNIRWAHQDLHHLKWALHLFIILMVPPYAISQYSEIEEGISDFWIVWVALARPDRFGHVPPAFISHLSARSISIQDCVGQPQFS